MELTQMNKCLNLKKRSYLSLKFYNELKPTETLTLDFEWEL